MKYHHNFNHRYKTRHISEYEAFQIARWVYEEPYSIYSFEPTPATMRELLDGSYHAVTNKYGDLTGYYCLGKNARIGDDDFTHPLYDDERFVDIGFGMQPDLTGQGRGATFLKICLAKASTIIGEKDFRLSVADFNKRAIRVYEKVGFKQIGVISAKDYNRRFDFIVMTRMSD